MNNEVLQMFKNYCLIFDIVRIIDPLVEKIILSNKEKDIEKKERTFLKLVDENGVYISSTSIKAYNERKTFMEVEYVDERLYACMSVPIEIDNTIFLFDESTFVITITPSTVLFFISTVTICSFSAILKLYNFVSIIIFSSSALTSL